MIIRARHDATDHYFRFRRATAQDSRLSWAARGVLAYLISKPDGWEISARDLERQGNLRRDGVRAVLTELEAHGYLKRRREHNPENGLFVWVSVVFESPPSTANPAMVDTANPFPPSTANPAMAPSTPLPSTANPSPYIRESAEREGFLPEEKREQQHADSPSAPGCPPGEENFAAVASARSGELGPRQSGAGQIAGNLALAPLTGPNDDFGFGSNWHEPHASKLLPASLLTFVRATKPHANNPEGLTRALWRSGAEDSQAESWERKQGLRLAPKREPDLTPAEVMAGLNDEDLKLVIDLAERRGDTEEASAELRALQRELHKRKEQNESSKQSVVAAERRSSG